MVRCDVEKRIDVKVLWIAYQLTEDESSWSGPDGCFRYARERTEDGLRSTDRGLLTNGVFELVREAGGRVWTQRFARVDYDFTSRDGVDALVTRDAPARDVRLLDFDVMEILTRRYRFRGAEAIRAGEARIDCRLVEFDDGNKRGKRWVAEDAWGLAIYRQDGKDRRGSHSLRILDAR
jgi:hypothetical protein